jgi:hypothetical protein
MIEHGCNGHADKIVETGHKTNKEDITFVRIKGLNFSLKIFGSPSFSFILDLTHITHLDSEVY